jgi:hypothetical protein
MTANELTEALELAEDKLADMREERDQYIHNYIQQRGLANTNEICFIRAPEAVGKKDAELADLREQVEKLKAETHFLEETLSR